MKNDRSLLSPREQLLLERLPVPLCVYRLGGSSLSLQAVSAGMCTLTGFSHSQLLALHSADGGWVHPDDRALVQKADAYALAHPQAEYCAHFRIKNAQHGWLKVLCSGQTELRGDGAQLLYLQYARMCGAAAAGAAPAFPQEPEEAPGAGSGLVARGHCNLSQNRMLEYVTTGEGPFSPAAGAPYDETVRAFLTSPVFSGDRDSLADLLNRENLIRRCLAGSTHFTVRYGCQKPGELPIWLSTALNTCVSPQTGDVECFSYTYDITDKTLEDQVFSRLPMLGFDVVGLLYVETHACRYFRIKQMRPGSLYEHLEDYYASIGEDIAKIVLPDQRDYVREGLRIETITAHLASDETYPFTYSMINREGKILQKLLQFSYLDESRSTIFFCKSDITRQTESEHRQIDELAAAKLAADRANEAKSMFLSSMSHDLRTPLGGIIGFTELALRADDCGKKQDYLTKIKLSADLLLALVNDTLELSRIESGKYVLEPEAVSTRELSSSVVTALRPLADAKNIRFLCDMDTLPAQAVWADKLKLQKVFLNLLSNAIKYTPAGGCVTARAQMLEPPQNGCNYRLCVSDTGIGMSREFLPRIFEPFSQEHRPEAANITGTGLGLSIVKRIVDLMGGTISVQSQPGRGSCFAVDLPLRILTAGDLPGAEDAAAAVQFAGRRVLLLEDNYLNTEIAALLLGEKGITADCVQNGKEGLAKFCASAPGYYDAVLTDIRMPLMDGYEAARAIRALPRPDAAAVPIVAMTADAFEDDVRKCREAGMDAHVAKPISPEALFRTLAQVLQKSASAPGGQAHP